MVYHLGKKVGTEMDVLLKFVDIMFQNWAISSNTVSILSIQ